jgi:hypothetical protein
MVLKIFGDSLLEYIVNGSLVIALIVVIWKISLKHLLAILVSIGSIFKREQLLTLEITPPHSIHVDQEATQHLISVLYQLMGKRERIALEITGSKITGIRYRLTAQEPQIRSLQKYLASYIPELKFALKPIELVADLNIFSIAQSRHYAYPLETHSDLAKTDPISFMISSMTQLNESEELTLQLIIRRHSLKKSMRIYNELLSTGSVKIYDNFQSFILAHAWLWVPSLIIGLFAQSWEAGTAVAVILWCSIFFTEKQIKIPTKLEDQLFTKIKSKLEQPLLRTDIRLGVFSPERTTSLVNDFASSLEPLNTTGFQRLKIRRQLLDDQLHTYRRMLFDKRLSSILPFNSSLLSTGELASLFHFPYGTIQTEGMARSHSRVLPAPLSLKAGNAYSVVIGNNHYHGAITPIGLTEAERERHVYIIGGTGNGKTTMLQYAIVQDIKNGKGVAVIDPHGDLAETLLRYIPEDRISDVIYMNPDDLEYPIGMNLLELPEGLSSNDLLREKDVITESVISVMRKIFSDDDSGGHRVEYVLRNTIQTALTLEHPTLFTIFNLLNDPKFRRGVVKTLEDENLKNFWKNELGKAGGYQQVKMVAGITAKIGRFLFSASAKRMLEQEKSTIDFDAILDGKILICNFSKGILGEDTSALFGTTVLTKLQLASLRRARKDSSSRRPFYLYVDEFQNFATMGFVQMLSEARKYKLFLTMAEQSTSQQEQQRLVDIILANVGTVICFRSGSPADERFVLPLFSPYIEQGEIANLPAYSFYVRITAVHSQEPLSGTTVLVNELVEVGVAEKVITHSREEYAIKISEQSIPRSPQKTKIARSSHPRIHKSHTRARIEESKNIRVPL